jgi:NADH dehydrogenase
VLRFVFFSALGASTRSDSRLMQAKAVAERAVIESSLQHTVFAPSLVYAPADPYLRLLRRMSLLPAMAIPGSGRTPFQPIWAQDVADCVLATLPGGPCADSAIGVRYELAGPQTLSQQDVIAIVLRSLNRRRPILKVPMPFVRRLLNTTELLLGPTAFATWDEAQLLEVPMISRHGTADAERLGVLPRSMPAVLGVG